MADIFITIITIAFLFGIIVFVRVIYLFIHNFPSALKEWQTLNKNDKSKAYRSLSEEIKEIIFALLKRPFWF
ncbi:MAG: hypothetical protein JEY94_12235 [Melioribacteraceae bacterium]|nr:hypothetical protein [Melioribacteraceae bacterium]